MPIFGGIEAGGTKFVCVIGAGPSDIRAEVFFQLRLQTKLLIERQHSSKNVKSKRKFLH
jgi:hypothetical protein